MEVGTFDVPEADAALSLEEICTTFVVDTKSKRLVKP